MKKDERIVREYQDSARIQIGTYAGDFRSFNEKQKADDACTAKLDKYDRP